MTELIWVLTSSLLILAVAAIRALFGRRMRPGLGYALWGLVLLRLLVPVQLFQAPWSIASAVQEARQTEVGGVAAFAVTEYELPRMSYSHAVSQVTADYQAAGVDLDTLGDSELESQAYHHMQSGVTPLEVLHLLWAVGTAVTAAVFLLANLRFYLRLRSRRIPLETDAPLRVYSVLNLSSSCLFAGAIYVSEETATDEERLRHVLAHELSHFRHGDLLWSLLRCVALAIHWWNPLVWWAAVLARQSSELFADAGALKRLGEAESERYGATLIELSARHAPKASLLCTATTMTSGKKSLKERVMMIARRPKMTLFALLAVVLIAAVAAGCAFAGAKKQEPTAPTDPGAPAAETTPVVQTPKPAEEPDAPSPGPSDTVELALGGENRVLAGRVNGDGWYLYIPVEGWYRADSGDNVACWFAESETGSTLQIREASREELTAEQPQLMDGQEERFVETADGRIWRVWTQYDPQISIYSDWRGLEPATLEAMANSFTVLIPSEDSEAHLGLIKAAGDALVMENGQVTAGRELFLAFADNAERGVPDTINVLKYYTLGDPDQYDPDLYEELKDEYPMLFTFELRYDGSDFVWTGYEDGEQIEQRYRHMVCLAEETETADGSWASTVRYVLVNDPNVTWEDITHGMFSSRAGDWIDHAVVYQEYFAPTAIGDPPLAVPLTEAELEQWRQTFRSVEVDEDGMTRTTLISCFFTSFYDDPRDIDLSEFLRYCPLAEEVTDAAEFDALNLDWEMGEDHHRATLSEMPVPVWRYKVSNINEVLLRYAGITLDDMSTDWRSDERMLYSSEYDAFYNFTSDFGPGTFVPEGGERNGNLLTLWQTSGDGRTLALRLRMTGNGGWQILSFLPEG